jgi:hypothetical protein
MTEIQILQKKICFLYENNVVKKWPCSLDKATLFVMYASSKDFQRSLSKDDVQLRKSLSNLQYYECVLSAFLFCIECKKHNKAELKIFISNSMYYFAPLFLIDDVRCQNSFSFILMELNLANLFPLQVVFGLVQYLTLSKVKEKPIIKLEKKAIIKGEYFYGSNIDYLDTVDQFLHLFSFFPTAFIEECKQDCMRLGNLVPISLALQV